MDEKMKQKIFANVLLTSGHTVRPRFRRTSLKKSLLGFAAVSTTFVAVLVLLGRYFHQM